MPKTPIKLGRAYARLKQARATTPPAPVPIFATSIGNRPEDGTGLDMPGWHEWARRHPLTSAALGQPNPDYIFDPSQVRSTPVMPRPLPPTWLDEYPPAPPEVQRMLHSLLETPVRLGKSAIMRDSDWPVLDLGKKPKKAKKKSKKKGNRK